MNKLLDITSQCIVENNAQIIYKIKLTIKKDEEGWD